MRKLNEKRNENINRVAQLFGARLIAVAGVMAAETAWRRRRRRGNVATKRRSGS